MYFRKLKQYPINTLGGKAQLIELLVQIVAECIYTYNLNGVIDACMGANRLYLGIDIDRELELKIGNEIDRGLVAFMKCLQNPHLTDDLIETICLTWDLYTEKEAFLDACSKRRNPETPLVEAAALTYIVSCFSRAADRQIFIAENARQGIDPSSLDKFQHLDEILEGVEIRQGDCLDIIHEFAYREDILTFVDPPYVEDDKLTGNVKETLGYEDAFTPLDQKKLLDTLISSSNKIVICGYDNKMYKRLEENGFNKYFIGLVNVYSSGKGRKRKEYIWCNFEVNEDLLPADIVDEDY